MCCGEDDLEVLERPACLSLEPIGDLARPVYADLSGGVDDSTGRDRV
jgi:hypothetical protein